MFCSSLLDMETQKVSSSNAGGLLDMQTQKIPVLEDKSNALLSQKNETYDHTKGSQKMDIDETIEKNNKAEEDIFDQPTQVTTMDEGDSDDDDA